MRTPYFVGSPFVLTDDPAARAVALARVVAFVRDRKPLCGDAERLRDALARGSLDGVLDAAASGFNDLEGLLDALAPAFCDHAWIAAWRPWGEVERLYVCGGRLHRQCAVVTAAWGEAEGMHAGELCVRPVSQKPVVSVPDAARL